MFFFMFPSGPMPTWCIYLFYAFCLVILCTILHYYHVLLLTFIILMSILISWAVIASICSSIKHKKEMTNRATYYDGFMKFMTDRK